MELTKKKEKNYEKYRVLKGIHQLDFFASG